MILEQRTVCPAFSWRHSYGGLNIHKNYLKIKFSLFYGYFVNHFHFRDLYKMMLSKKRPLADSFIESRCQSIYVSVPFHVIFFRGLSLALRSHDQIPASHWSTPHPASIGNRPRVHLITRVEP